MGTRVRPDDRLVIKASEFNSWQDAADDLKARRAAGWTGRATAPPVDTTTVVLCKNASGAARRRFDVLGIAGPIIDPADNLEGFKQGVAVRGITPTEAQRDAFVVLQAPAAPDTVVPSVISGATIARVYVASESHRFAVAAAGAHADILNSSTAGIAQLLWIQPLADREIAEIALCVVRMGGGGGDSSAIEIADVVALPTTPPAEGFDARLRDENQTLIRVNVFGAFLPGTWTDTGPTTFPPLLVGMAVPVTQIDDAWYSLWFYTRLCL
ncbi:hypothetical protein RAS1_42340 [Phycisphaerae bacterium RAS1]|nr:hypothetical protein RAS1_42340 [Phycisphaerae bacterium RAS1]